MSSKKELLARGISSLMPIASRLRSQVRSDVRILAYHRIWDIRHEDQFPFDAELVSATPAEFRWQMEHLRKHHHPISLRQLLAAIDGQERLPRQPVIVTFDDGYEDNYVHAWPVLRDLGIPATIFLSTDYIGGNKTFWYDHLAHQFLTAPEQMLTVQGLNGSVKLNGSLQSRREALRGVLSQLKQVPNTLRLQILDRLCANHGMPQNVAAPESRPMTWDQAREMAGGGIEFGSHTVSHPILSTLTESELQRELVDSRLAIQEQLRQPADVLAYPVGGRSAYNAGVRRVAAAVGYRLGMAYHRGINKLSSLDHLGLSRIAVERYVSRALFKSMLALPEVF